MRPTSFAFLAALLLPAAAGAQPLTSAEAAKVDAVVADTLKATGVPSASIAIVRDGKIAFTKAYGNATLDGKAATAADKYPIASISKQFTAAAILLLADEGKLSLDDPIAKWVPGITDGDRITIRQLLSHTAGLQDYWPQDYSFPAMLKPTTPQGIVDRWAKKPLDFAPGTQWQYSNTGYVVAGMIVEKAAGEPLLAFLTRRVFEPLGTHPVNQDKAVGPGYPTGTHRFALGPVHATPAAADGWFFAMGELAMTATDLAKWDVARIDRTILPASDWTTQETPVALTSGASTGYGLGVEVTTEKKQRAIEHDGEGAGFLSHNIVFPETKDAIVVLVNADFGDAEGQIADGIEDKVLFPPPPGLAAANEDAETARARGVFDQLTAGHIDEALLTADARYYFTPTALGDYARSLSVLGKPKSFTAPRGPRLRGGFVNRNYIVDYGTRKLAIVTYAEPGGAHRYEQFIVMPAS